jgi:hypothetical protein
MDSASSTPSSCSPKDSLLRLIRGAAIQAVLDGTEKITRAALDSIGIDTASETADASRRRPRSRP